MLSPLPNENISDLSKLKAIADKNLTETQNWKFVCGRVKKLEKILVTSIFSFPHNVFQIHLAIGHLTHYQTTKF